MLMARHVDDDDDILTVSLYKTELFEMELFLTVKLFLD